MKAIGMYVGLLRSEWGWTQADLAGQVGISEKSVRNLENGRHEPKLTKLAEIVALVRGSSAHVAELMQPTASLDRARELAREAINQTGFTDEQRALLESLSPEKKAALLAVARQMQDQ